MKDQNKKKDKNNFEEFKSVRFFSNINGKNTEYGYDYSRDSEGKEEYKEYGDPSQFNEGSIEDRIRKTEDVFSSNQFSNDFSFFSERLPKLSEVFNNFLSFIEPEQTKSLPFYGPTNENDAHVQKAEQDIDYDIQEDIKNDEIHIIAELPGFTKKDINLKVSNDGIKLTGATNTRSVDTFIPLNYEIDKKKVKASMKNGILEISMKISNKKNDGDFIPIN